MQEQLSRNEVTKQSVSGCVAGYEIAALAAPDILSSRGTCTSLYIALAMTGCMN
jgi:hypothetical protein